MLWTIIGWAILTLVSTVVLVLLMTNAPRLENCIHCGCLFEMELDDKSKPECENCNAKGTS